jgi:hypothetical protein
VGSERGKARDRCLMWKYSVDSIFIGDYTEDKIDLMVKGACKKVQLY